MIQHSTCVVNSTMESSSFRDWKSDLDNKHSDNRSEAEVDFSDEVKSDDTSCVYILCESSDYKLITKDYDSDAASSIEEENHKNVYMVIVDGKKTNSDPGFYCEVCNLAFRTAAEVNKHLTTHELDCCKKCEMCNNIVYKNVYEIHMKLHKEAFKKSRVKNKTQCKSCGKFVTKTYLKFHMKMHGTQNIKNERLKQCPICNKFVSYYYYSSHIKRIHSKLQENTNPSDKKVTKCPICGRLFKNSFFEKHVASHGHHKKQYICDKCGKVSKHYSAFRTHLLTHSGDLRYKCQFCPYRGLHLGLLKVHVRTHTKDYLYKCPICNKKFLTKSNLSGHQRRHKAPTSFVCPECNRGFYSKRNLDKHFNMIHMGIRNEKCEICGKAFGYRDGLISHQNKVHNREKSTYKGRLPSYLKVKHTIPNIEDEK